jgi:hypothetical protein
MFEITEYNGHPNYNGYSNEIIKTIKKIEWNELFELCMNKYGINGRLLSPK